MKIHPSYSGGGVVRRGVLDPRSSGAGVQAQAVKSRLNDKRSTR